MRHSPPLMTKNTNARYILDHSIQTVHMPSDHPEKWKLQKDDKKLNKKLDAACKE